MRVFFCSKCGQGLPEGTLKFVVDVSIFADIDGRLYESEEVDNEKELKVYLDDLDDAEASDIDDDILHEINFILCKACKEKFQETIFHPLMTSIEDGIKTKGTVH